MTYEDQAIAVYVAIRLTSAAGRAMAARMSQGAGIDWAERVMYYRQLVRRSECFDYGVALVARVVVERRRG